MACCLFRYSMICWKACRWLPTLLYGAPIVTLETWRWIFTSLLVQLPWCHHSNTLRTQPEHYTRWFLRAPMCSHKLWSMFSMWMFSVNSSWWHYPSPWVGAKSSKPVGRSCSVSCRQLSTRPSSLSAHGISVSRHLWKSEICAGGTRRCRSCKTMACNV